MYVMLALHFRSVFLTHPSAFLPWCDPLEHNMGGEGVLVVVVGSSGVERILMSVKSGDGFVNCWMGLLSFVGQT